MAQYRSTVSEQGRELEELQAEHRELREAYAAVLDSLQFYDDIDSGRFYRLLRSRDDRINRLEYELSVSRDGGLTVATIQADDLFEPASADLTSGGASRLAELAATLDEKHVGGSIRIEGHSDSVPVGPQLQEQYPSNWELSAARAATVARYLIDEAGVEPARIEVVSFGSARPVATNATAEGRSRNRRIRIAAIPAAPGQTAAADQRN